MAARLTDAMVRKALPPACGQTMLWDGDVKGFALRVTPGGAKAFVLDYRAEGRQRRITIGQYPDWSVQAARNTAKELKREVDHGRDPMGDRHAERTAPTVQELWERYQLEHLPRKTLRSQVDERIMWEKIILPRFGRMKLAAITADDIDSLHHDITTVRGTPIRANRTVEVLRKAFNLAIRWNWREDNPASGVRKNPEEKRNRYLNRNEITMLARAVQDHNEPVTANAIKLLMLTGARRGEVLGATWDMFDLENGVWTKPSAHTKQRRLHRVPLNSQALQLVREMRYHAIQRAKERRAAINPFLFPGSDGKPLSDIKRSWLSICRKAGLAEKVEERGRDGKRLKTKDGEPIMTWRTTVRVHDLRHSFASILVSAGASLPLIGQMLGHTQPVTTARYAHLFDDPLRQAAETVGTFILPEISEQGLTAPSPAREEVGHAEFLSMGTDPRQDT
jgi:integrase